MQFCNFSDKRQSETVAFGSMGNVSLIKTVKYVFLSSAVHSDAVISDTEKKRICGTFRMDGDASGNRRKFNCVVNQIDPDFLEQIRISDNSAALKGKIKTDLFFFPFFLQLQNCLADLLINVIFGL